MSVTTERKTREIEAEEQYHQSTFVCDKCGFVETMDSTDWDGIIGTPFLWMTYTEATEIRPQDGRATHRDIGHLCPSCAEDIFNG